MGWIQYHRVKKGKKKLSCVLPNLLLNRVERYFVILSKMRTILMFFYWGGEQKIYKASSMTQGRKVYHNTSNQMTAGAFFSVPPNLPLKFCSLYQNPQIRVEKIRRPLWLCVNDFKK